MLCGVTIYLYKHSIKRALATVDEEFYALGQYTVYSGLDRKINGLCKCGIILTRLFNVVII